MGVLQTVLDGVEVASTRDGVEVLLGHRAWAASRRPVGLLSVATDRCGGVRSLLRVFDPCGGGALGSLSRFCSLASVQNPNRIPRLL
jgi:hypothetical protein